MADAFANLKTAGPARRRVKKGDTRKSLRVYRLSHFCSFGCAGTYVP